MPLIKSIYQHWPTVSLGLGAVSGWGIHAYRGIVAAGGIKNIWARFWNGAAASAIVPPVKPCDSTLQITKQ